MTTGDSTVYIIQLQFLEKILSHCLTTAHLSSTFLNPEISIVDSGKEKLLTFYLAIALQSVIGLCSATDLQTLKNRLVYHNYTTFC